MTLKKQIQEAELIFAPLAEEIIEIGVNIGIAKSIINVIYSFVDTDANITKRDVMNLIVILHRLIIQISNQFENFEQKINL